MTSVANGNSKSKWPVVQQLGGHESLVKFGYTVFPNALFIYGEELGLSGNDLLVLLSLLNRRRNAELATPGYRTIALDTGIHKDTVMSVVAKLSERGLIRVYKRKNSSSRYDLQPLFDKLAECVAIDGTEANAGERLRRHERTRKPKNGKAAPEAETAEVSDPGAWTGEPEPEELEPEPDGYSSGFAEMLAEWESRSSDDGGSF